MPQTFNEFLAWLLTAGGLSIATAFVVGGIIRVFGAGWTDLAKRIVAGAVPFGIVLIAVLLQAALHVVPWSIDNLWQALILALQLVAGSQGAYQILWKVIVRPNTTP